MFNPRLIPPSIVLRLTMFPEGLHKVRALRPTGGNKGMYGTAMLYIHPMDVFSASSISGYAQNNWVPTTCLCCNRGD